MADAPQTTQRRRFDRWGVIFVPKGGGLAALAGVHQTREEAHAEAEASSAADPRYRFAVAPVSVEAPAPG